MVFQHSGGEMLTFPDTLSTQGLSLWCFNIVGGESLTFPDTLSTQGLSLWCFNIVGGEILTFPDTLITQGLSLWCFNIVGGEILARFWQRRRGVRLFCVFTNKTLYTFTARRSFNLAVDCLVEYLALFSDLS